MKIVHCCIGTPYIDGWGYQENIMPAQHAKMGHNVTVITTRLILSASYYQMTKEDYEKPSEYYLSGVKVIRLEHRIKSYRFAVIRGLHKTLEREKPDLIYVHGVQTLELLNAVKYKQKHTGTVLFVDAHSDYQNSARSFVSRNIQHKLIWRGIVQKCSPYIDKFYCITPGICNFVNEMYGIPMNRLELLTLGGETEKIHYDDKKTIKKQIRAQYGINENSIVIINGGKLSEEKRTRELIEAINKIVDNSIDLIVFGNCDNEYQLELANAAKNNPRIHFVGWIESDAVYNYYLASDIACFPGGESVLWQQAICCGLPLICKLWQGGEYLDVGGNVEFIYSDSQQEIIDKINKLIGDPQMINKMSMIALGKGTDKFAYKNIAKKVIDDARALSNN